jgi:hypothetical protein
MEGVRTEVDGGQIPLRIEVLFVPDWGWMGGIGYGCHKLYATDTVIFDTVEDVTQLMAQSGQRLCDIRQNGIQPNISSQARFL